MGRQRKTKAAEVTRSPEELALTEKYEHDFVVGSLLMADDAKNPFYGKRSVEFRCACGAARRVATSDLFHVAFCVQCSKDAKKNRRDKKKLAKK